MSLQSLPNEILLVILSHLPSHNDAAALSLQCHRWHQLCDMSNRHKYRRVKLQGILDMAVAFKMLWSILKTPRYGAYVRHVELNRSISQGLWHIKSYTIRSPQRSLQPEDQVHLAAAIKQAGFHCPEKQEKMLYILLQNPDNMEYLPFLYTFPPFFCSTLIFISQYDPRAPLFAQALAALLVSVSPFLDSLSLCSVNDELSEFEKRTTIFNGTPLDRKYYFFKEFLDRANSIPQETLPFLHHLRQVRFLVDADKMFRNIQLEPYDLSSSLNLVRQLPAVKSVRVDSISSMELQVHELPPQSANYTSITIRNSVMEFYHLVPLIKSAKRLEEFTYAVGGRRPVGRTPCIFRPDDVFRALHSHADSLTNLDLDVETETQLAVIFKPRKFSRPSSYVVVHPSGTEVVHPALQREHSSPLALRGLTNLKRLSLGIHILYYLSRGIGADQVDDASFAIADHLPPNLEALCIYGYHRGMKPQARGLPNDVFDRQLERLLAEKHTKLPRLSCIEGIDEFIKNGAIQPPKTDDEYWESETDDEWTDHEYE